MQFFIRVRQRQKSCRAACRRTQVAAVRLGGALVAGTDFTRAGTQALINISPEPFSNWAASVGEDVGRIGGLHLMWQHPPVLLVLLCWSCSACPCC